MFGSASTKIISKIPYEKSCIDCEQLRISAQMKPLYFVRNVEHRKQSATRPCRMLALIGMLVCAARLLAIPRKTFFQGRGMHRPIGIMYLRPLVGAFSAILAAILLYAANHADAQSQAAPMIGIMYLEYADSV